MTLYELQAKLFLDTSEYDKGIGESKSKLSSFGSGLKNGLSTIAKVGAGALAGASAAVVAFGTKSVQTGMTFDKAMSQVGATLGYTTAELSDKTSEASQNMEKLRNFAQEMGAKTAFSATQASEALNYMALAGYDTEKSMRMLPNVLNMAAAGNMDLAKASDMVTDASSALGLTEKQTTAMVDQMAAASSKSNTSVEQLGEALLRVGGTAKIVRGGTTELNTALGILADNGTKGAEAGTAMRNILMGISSAKFEKSFGALGVSAYDSEGRMRNLKDVFGDMQKAMDGMTDKERTDIISKAFNARDLKNVQALLGTTADRWDQLSASIDNSKGAAEAMANTQLDNLAGDITLFNSALEGAQIAISDKLNPALRTFVQEGTEGMQAFGDAIRSGDFSGAMQIAGETIANITTTALSKVPDLINAGAQLLMGIGKGFMNEAPNLISSLSSSIPTIISSITSMFSGADFSSAMQMGMDFIGKIGEGAISAVPTLLEMIPGVLEMVSTGLMDAMSGFTEMIVPLMEQLGTSLQENIPVLLEAVLPMLEQFTASLRENAGTLISAGLDLILKLAQGIINSIPTLLSYIPQIIINIAGIINDNAPKVLMAGVKLIVMLGKGIIQSIPALIANFPKIISAIVAVWSAINWASLGTKALNAIKSGLAAAPSIIGGLLKSAGSAAGKAFRSVNWASVGKGAINLLKGGVSGAGRLILTAMKNIGKSAFNAFKSINWISLGRNIISGIGRGISGAAGIIVNAAKNAAKRAFNAAKSFLGIKSPSRLFRDKIGKNIGLGMALGIEDTENNVERAITGLNTDIADADIMSGIPIDTGGIDVTGGIEGTPATAGAIGSTYIFNITNNVSGAENPEDFVDRMVRRLQLRMRMA